MAKRLDVLKTYKLFIGGKFPRSESGRTLAVADRRGDVVCHVCRGSRKDLRDAVSAARSAQAGWAGATAYLRGQILYRVAEMLEGKRDEFVGVLRGAPGGGGKAVTKAAAEKEVHAAIDRLVCFAGWADKYAQVLGCNNPVSGPYYNFTVPEPTGVVAVVSPDRPALLGMVSLLAPVICSGNAAVVVGSEANPVAAAVFGEVCATGDVPPGVVNVLTGLREELVPVIAGHRDIDGVFAAGVGREHRRVLEEGAAENLKRVTVLGDKVGWFDAGECHSPWRIEPFVEMKTVWHPIGS